VLQSKCQLMKGLRTHTVHRLLSVLIWAVRTENSGVKPIFQQGDKNDTPNYRPISMLTSFSKIFEKVIYNRLYQHINTNQMLVNERFGFRHSSSTDKRPIS
jgi:hypothetical protein